MLGTSTTTNVIGNKRLSGLKVAIILFAPHAIYTNIFRTGCIPECMHKRAGCCLLGQYIDTKVALRGRAGRNTIGLESSVFADVEVSSAYENPSRFNVDSVAANLIQEGHVRMITFRPSLAMCNLFSSLLSVQTSSAYKV